MLRRDLLAALSGAFLPWQIRAEQSGAAVVADVKTRRLLAVREESIAGRARRAPGSTLKPLVLGALMKRGKLTEKETFPCSGQLSIAGRSLNCSHPPLDAPVRVETAIAYSCNCFVAHMAERFDPGELARELEAAGLGAPSGLLKSEEASGVIEPARSHDAILLQALGEAGIEVTVAGLAAAYRALAGHAAPAILAGMEGAVQYGTAQYAQVKGMTVAGKTGSVRMPSGERVAWFAGFMPSHDPQVALAVALQGRSGGSDAAPIAGELFERYRAGRL